MIASGPQIDKTEPVAKLLNEWPVETIVSTRRKMRKAQKEEPK